MDLARRPSTGAHPLVRLLLPMARMSTTRIGWLASVAVLGGGLALAAQAAEMSTPPIASRSANTFLTCALHNAGTKGGTARVQIVQVPDGAIVADTGDQTVAPGAGLTAGAIASVVGPTPPDCTNGDCPCPNTGGTESCGHFIGTAYCRFTMKEGKGQYRAAGCVSSPAQAPVSSPTCLEAR